MHGVLAMSPTGVSLAYGMNWSMHISMCLVKWLPIYKTITIFSLNSFIYAPHSLPFTLIKMLYTWPESRSRCVSLRTGRSEVRTAVTGVIFRTHPDGQEAHTASCTMGTGSLSGGKAAGAWRGVDHPPPPSAEFECSYTSLPPHSACLTALYCNKLKTVVCSKIFFYYLPECCNLSEDIQQSY
jgi:hypothetical protein